MFKRICIGMVCIMVAVTLFGCGKQRQDFAYDVVLVVLTKEATIESDLGRNYKLEDFAEIGITKIDILSTLSLDFVANPYEFRSSLKLTLKKPSRENVLDAVEKLKKRSDIDDASVDGYASFDV